MSRVRSLIPCLLLFGLGFGFVPALSGCGESASTGATAGLTKEEEKQKQDEATLKAFQDFQKTKKKTR